MLTVTFYTASWCASCKLLKPHWVRYVSEHKGEATFRVVEEDTAPGVVKAAMVQSFPTVIIADKKTEIGRITNAPKTYTQFKKSLDPYLPTA